MTLFPTSYFLNVYFRPYSELSKTESHNREEKYHLGCFSSYNCNEFLSKEFGDFLIRKVFVKGRFR